ncbi:MAG: GNAT family N-acetyltransferase [Chloroflexota bacterium]
MAELESAGFASQADVGENSWTKVLMKCSRESVPIAANLADGFTIRPLAGENEVQAYVDLHQAVFQSKSMTTEWRQRTLQQPAYNPDVDLVAVAPDGTLAAFCICWLNTNRAGEITGQIEPLGVSEDFRKLGLGRSILTEGLQRLKANGAQSIYLETDNYRDEAYALYESVGFRVAKDVLVYRKDYGEF